MNTISRFFKPVFDTPLLSTGSFFLALCKAGSNLIWPYFVSQLIVWIESKDTQMFLLNLKLYALLSVMVWLINFFTSRVWRRYHFDEMRAKIYKQELLAFSLLSNNETEKIWTWKANSIIQKWADRRIDLINAFFSNFLQSGFVVIAIFVWVYIDLSLYWFVLFLGVWVVCMSISIYGNKILKKERAKRKAYVTEGDRRIIRYVMSKFEMLLSNKVFSELSIVDTIFSRLQTFGKNIAIKQIVAVDVIYMTTAAIMVFWLWYAGHKIIDGTMLFGEFTLRWMLFGRMRWNIENTIYGLTSWFDGWTHVEKLRNFHDNPNKISWYDDGKTFEYNEWTIILDSVSYSYGDKKGQQKSMVFDGFSLRIVGKQKTALVGSSWWWKSTLVKLIAWYLRPLEWKVIIDGQDLTEVSLKSYYKHIWYLTQEPSIFDGTIIDNLTYAIEGEVDDKSLKECISLAKCEFIWDLKDWLNTEIWERWIRLSWWQRQRLAIAKIFLKNPTIIILDEPTSALDSFSEESITIAMENLFENRTVVIIAHRLQTVKNADDIIVLDEWKVIERGTHDQLVELWWSYAKMLELQSGF